MKKSVLLVFIVFVSSQFSLANPLNWIKNKMGSAWFTYKTWNIPRPVLIEHNTDDMRKFEEFRYDLPGSYPLGLLCKKLHIFGDYVSDESDMQLYKEYVKNRPNRIDRAYLDASFDLNYDNSINACMFRLLNDWGKRVRPIMDNQEVEPFIQLLWQIEDCLPKKFDEDQTGAYFLIFIFTVIENGLPELKEEIPGMLPEISAAKYQKAKDYLLVWQHHSLRFRNNKWLARAISVL